MVPNAAESAASREPRRENAEDSAPGFDSPPDVINGFCDLIPQLCGAEADDHPSSAVGMAELPLACRWRSKSRFAQAKISPRGRKSLRYAASAYRSVMPATKSTVSVIGSASLAVLSFGRSR